MKSIPFKFSLLPGDLINAMAGIRYVCEQQGTKADLYLGLDIEFKMIDELKIGRKSPYTLTAASMRFLRPLLMSQPYINSVNSLEECFPDIYHGWCDLFLNFDQEKLNDWYRVHREIIDLDQNHCVPIGLPAGNIFRSNFYIYPDMACDLSKPWIEFNPNPDVSFPSPTIIVNRTLRCRNKNIKYDFLKKYGQIAFIGHNDEFNAFKEESQLGYALSHLICGSADHIRLWLSRAKLFIGNQSLCFSIAEAMKIPRVLEICPQMNNVIPSGPDGYDAWYQGPMEYFVDKLMNKL